MNWLVWLSEAHVAGMPLWRVGALFACILAALAAGRVMQVILSRLEIRVQRAERRFVSIALRALDRSAVLLFFAFGLTAGVRMLVLSPTIHGVVITATSMLTIAAVGWTLYCLVDVVDAWIARAAAKSASKMDDMLAPMVRKSLRVTIVVLVLVQMAQTLSDKPITSILAGLGVGGLAVALAAQETIKNFFGSLVILGDKPFELGDRVVVDGHDGSVESVGFRSTRIRTLEGNLVTVPNGELANKTILNIGKRPHIRRLFNVTLTYDTPPEKIERAIAIIRELLQNHEGLSPDFPPRVAFNEFNSASLNIVVIYWYHPPDYWAYLAHAERLNLALLRRFNTEGIEFAFPTQTLFMAGDPRRPLNP
ncbi:MAG: mechanosensitive ion channel family protein [Lentisphaerae bacterium]|nr:mechanosensitive ion channel family protein [Lentisphaerota bacterium]